MHMRNGEDEKRELRDNVNLLMDSVHNFHREKQVLVETLDQVCKN